MRPRTKPLPRLTYQGRVVLLRPDGSGLALRDPDGAVSTLLGLADGTLDTAGLVERAAAALPGVAASSLRQTLGALVRGGVFEDADATTSLSDEDLERYRANLSFFAPFARPQVSRYSFQESMRQARVVLLGAGGIGSTVLLNLAGLGVGHVTVVDDDHIERSNLNRQFAYGEATLGWPKVTAAVRRAKDVNPTTEVVARKTRVAGVEDVALLLAGADLVVSTVDRPPEVRDWVDEACRAVAVPLIGGGVTGAMGLYYAVDPEGPCTACFSGWSHQRLPGGMPATVDDPAATTALGPMVSVLGGLMAMEATRMLSGFTVPVATGRAWTVDFVGGGMRETPWTRQPGCPRCGVGAAGGSSQGVGAALAGAGG